MDVVGEVDVAVLATDLDRLLVSAAYDAVHAPFEDLRDPERTGASWRRIEMRLIRFGARSVLGRRVDAEQLLAAHEVVADLNR
jgi:hypothetical protein